MSERSELIGETVYLGSTVERCAGKDAEIERLQQRLQERTTERDYHMHVADQLAKRIRKLEARP